GDLQAVPVQPVVLLPRRHRHRARRQEQRTVPGGARVRPGHRGRHAEDDPADHRVLLGSTHDTALTAGGGDGIIPSPPPHFPARFWPRVSGYLALLHFPMYSFWRHTEGGV